MSRKSSARMFGRQTALYSRTRSSPPPACCTRTRAELSSPGRSARRLVAVAVRVAQVRRRPAVRGRLRDEDGHVARTVGADQEPRARLRPVHGRVDDERFRRRRERRGLLPADRLHGGGRPAPGVRRRAAPVAGDRVGTRTAERPRRRRARRNRRAYRVRQGADTPVPVGDGRRRDGRGPVLQPRGRHPQHPSAVLLFQT